MINRWIADNETPAATIAERKARQERQFEGARIPCFNEQQCDRCKRYYVLPSFLLMAYADNGEIVRRQHFRSMTETEVTEMTRNMPEDG